MSVDVILFSMQSNIRDSEVMDMLIMLILDFIDEYLSLTTDRKTKIISQSFKGPEKDISFSLDHSTPEQISRESWLDLSDTVLASIRRDWNMKASRKGLFVYYISGCPGFIIGTHDCPKYLKRRILCTVDHLSPTIGTDYGGVLISGVTLYRGAPLLCIYNSHFRLQKRLVSICLRCFHSNSVAVNKTAAGGRATEPRN